jgi:hypothetical protein
MPLDRVAASHDAAMRPNPDYPAAIQPRDRTRQASAAQIAEIAGNLDPAQLGADRMADRGAPIVAKIAGKWAVVSGNGRKIAFDRLARGTHANWDNYRRYWAAHATEVGIDPEAVAANPGGFLARVRPAAIRGGGQRRRGRAGARRRATPGAADGAV